MRKSLLPTGLGIYNLIILQTPCSSRDLFKREIPSNVLSLTDKKGHISPYQHFLVSKKLIEIQ